MEARTHAFSENPFANPPVPHKYFWLSKYLDACPGPGPAGLAPPWGPDSRPWGVSGTPLLRLLCLENRWPGKCLERGERRMESWVGLVVASTIDGHVGGWKSNMKG